MVINMKTSWQGSQNFTSDTLIPFLTNMDTTDKLALALVTTLSASTQSERRLVLINLWISKLKYPRSILCLKFLCFWTGSMCIQLLTCIFRRVEVYIPSFECLYDGCYLETHAWWRQKGMFSLFAFWDDALIMTIITSTFFIYKKNIWGGLFTAPFKIYHDQTARLYSRFLSQ